MCCFFIDLGSRNPWEWVLDELWIAVFLSDKIWNFLLYDKIFGPAIDLFAKCALLPVAQRDYNHRVCCQMVMFVFVHAMCFIPFKLGTIKKLFQVDIDGIKSMFKSISVVYEELPVISKPKKLCSPKRNNQTVDIQWESAFLPLLKFRPKKELQDKLQKHIGNGTIHWGNCWPFFLFFFLIIYSFFLFTNNKNK